MALLQLIFNKPVKTQINAPSNEQGDERQLLIIDASDNINHDNSAEPTDNPIEDGSLIQDHVDIMARQVSFQGVISEAPISIEQAVVGNVAGAVTAVSGLAGGLGGSLLGAGAATLGGLLLNQSGNRVQEAHQALLQIQVNKIPVTIITGLQAYQSMFLTSYNPTESFKNGRSLIFTATFKEIVTVQSELIVLPDKVLDPGVKNSAASKQSQGKQVSETADESVGSSWLSSATGIGAL